MQMKSRIEETVSAARFNEPQMPFLGSGEAHRPLDRWFFFVNRLWAPKFTDNCTYLALAKQTDAVKSERTQPFAIYLSSLLYWTRLTAVIQQPVQKCVTPLRDNCKHFMIPNYFKILYFHNGPQYKLLAYSANVQATNACSSAEGIC